MSLTQRQHERRNEYSVLDEERNVCTEVEAWMKAKPSIACKKQYHKRSKAYRIGAGGYEDEVQ
jgi:hypothetical protein